MTVLIVALAGCGDGESSQESTSADRPVVVATTNILGDVLDNLAGDQFDVVTIMPVGADPHDFQPSARDVAAIESASAIIANGANFEEGLLDAVEAAEDSGASVLEAITLIDVVASDSHDHGDHDGHDDGEDHDDHDDGEDHADEDDPDDHEDHGEDHGDDDDDHDDHDDHDGGEDHADEDDHDDHEDHGSVDPHFFTDPARMAVAVDGIADFLIANVDTIDAAELRSQAASYMSTLETLDAEVESMLAAVPESRRVLVTNHQVFAYFAERYDFEVIGTVVPTGSDTQGVSGQRLADLAALLEREGVSVVFTDTSAADDLAQTLASEVGDASVVELFSESLGGGDSDGSTYVDMVRSNASRIADALGG